MKKNAMTKTDPSSGASPPASATEFVQKTDDAAELATKIGEIQSFLGKAKGASKESLLHFKSSGDLLVEIKTKKIIAHGKWEDWLRSSLNMSRKWASQLMRLSSGWHHIEPHLDDWEWKRGAYGVDETCAAIREITGKNKRASQDGEPEKKNKANRKTRAELEADYNQLQPESEEKIASLRKERDNLKAKIQKLQEEIAELRGAAEMASATGHSAKNGSASASTPAF